MATHGAAPNAGFGGAGMFDFMKASMLTNAMGSGAGAAGGGMSAGITQFIYLTVIQFLFELVKQAIAFIEVIVKEWWKAKSETAKKNVDKLLHTNSVMGTARKTPTFEHTFKRKFGANVGSQQYLLADALLHYVAHHTAASKLVHYGDLVLLNTNEELELEPGIFFQQENTLFSSDDQLVAINFRIWTTNSENKALLALENSLVEQFWANKQNSLGSKIYFFDQFHASETRQLGADGRSYTPKATSIRFVKHEFQTGRRLNNIFFPDRSHLMQRFNFFMRNRAWYDARGIPYTLGLLLHGTPGCGKTSTIKAIANETGRHIVNVNFGRLNSKAIMKKLFYDPMLDVVKPDSLHQANLESLYVPVNKRVYVMEDADCMLGSVLLSRTLKDRLPAPPIDKSLLPAPGDIDNDPVGIIETSVNAFDSPFNNPSSGPGSSFASFSPPKGRSLRGLVQEKPAVKAAGKKDDDKDDDELDLSTLLSILDGTLETPGRILIMTSNHPEMFDSALIRPGRIDMMIKFEKCNASMLVEMAQMYYDDDIGTCMQPDEMWEAAGQVPEQKWSPAEVTALLLKHYNSRRDVWAELRDGQPTNFD